MKQKILKSKTKNLRWFDFEAPEEKLLLKLQKEFGFYPEDLADCDIKTQRPKITNRGRYLFLILHIPVFNREDRQTHTAELDIFVTKKEIITLHPKRIGMLKKIQTEIILDEIEKNKHDSVGLLLYKLLNELFGELFEKLDHISDNIDKVEESIFKKENVIQEILILKRDILNFRKIIRPQRTVLDPLGKKISKEFFENDLSVQFNSVISNVIQLWNILESHKEMIVILENTNESLLTQRLNRTMALVAILTLVTIPITILAGITKEVLIFQEPIFFIVVGLLTVLILLVLIYILKKKKIL